MAVCIDKVTSSVNDLTVLNTIRRRGPISRIDIARLTNLTPPTVINIANKLLDADLILEYMIGESSGGRRPLLLKTNPGFAELVVVLIRSKNIEIYRTDAEAEIIQKITRNIEKSETNEILEWMLEAIEQCRSEAKAPIAAISVVVRGPVNSAAGISLYAPSIGWRNIPLKSIIEDKFQLPVFVENDVKAITRGIYYHDLIKETSNVVILKVGHGIGAGIIINGELYRGMTNSAGEIGHTIIDVAGPVCSCGNYGCFEALASETALEASVVRAIKEGQRSIVSDLVQNDLEQVSAEAVYQAAAAGDELSIAVLKQVARYLGMGVANIFNIFNPEMVVIGGGLERAQYYIEETVLQTVEERAMGNSFRAGEIRFATIEESTLKGAVDTALAEVL
ncbi:hypothetical protein P22_3739 [Propionispora sp. 2/2-37]|uniref:ROK family transcriptional regulator n=1 Tax=Propionispora sp. 2/2-37 TaxID=1677858 RepID=UPI0006C0740B|nr:ROK family transcriptional regulator [Propionispora sp. 2/2-37]CUH97608.1 hypothetical protein P22_3739 [Propionispora sp. 2/2-37]